MGARFATAPANCAAMNALEAEPGAIFKFDANGTVYGRNERADGHRGIGG